MRTTVTIDDDLLAEIKQIAARDSRTVSEIVQDALRATVSRARFANDAAARRIELPTFGKPGDTPLVDILDKEALAEAMGDHEYPYRVD